MASWARSSGVGGLTLIESGTKSIKKPVVSAVVDGEMNTGDGAEETGDGEAEVDDEDRLSMLSVSSETSEDYHQQRNKFGIKKKQPQQHENSHHNSNSSRSNYHNQPEKRIRGDDDALMKEVQEEFKKAQIVRDGAQVVVDSLRQHQH